LRTTPGDDLEVDQETRLSQVNELSEGPALGIDFDWESVIDIIDDIVSGLIYLHDQGTAHRDLKPKNGNHNLFAC
jgi:serine/threonine protein kinase